ncbi:MAG: glycoside hydrolase family 92 protein, partial [Rikenellaceae bacterium]|nr:glycoside hydrolase family 92 protein [Rikenellaceae bacterium]
LYPPVPGVPEFIITSPVFDKVTIELDPDYYPAGSLVIDTHGIAPGNVYVDRVSVAGKTLKGRFIDQKTLTSAKHIDIYLSDKH